MTQRDDHPFMMISAHLQLTSSLALKGQLHHLERIRQSLHTNTNGPMTEIAPPRLLDGVKVPLDHSVQILSHHLGNVPQVIQVEASLATKAAGDVGD